MGKLPRVVNENFSIVSAALCLCAILYMLQLFLHGMWAHDIGELIVSGVCLVFALYFWWGFRVGNKKVSDYE